MTSKRFLIVLATVASVNGLGGCVAAKTEPEFKKEYYFPQTRQLPPDDVYARTMWTHPPQPIRPKPRETAPLLMPNISVEFENSTLEESLDAVSQSVGYRWRSSRGLATKPISVRMEGTVDEVLDEIGRQADVSITFDHDARMIVARPLGAERVLPKATTKESRRY
jgi:hypothetical protein